MTRHLIAASLAAVMFASPAIALAADAPATSTYSDTAPKTKKHHTHHSKKSKKTAADTTAK